MGYYTTDELEHFNFAGAEIQEIREYRDQLIFELGFVTILPENSCNRDVREMGTNALTLKLVHVDDVNIVLEGYKVFDADGNLRDKCEDEVVDKSSYPSVYQNLQGSAIYSLEQKENEYTFCIDAVVEEEDRTYLFKVKAQNNSEEWERFMNKVPTY